MKIVRLGYAFVAAALVVAACGNGDQGTADDGTADGGTPDGAIARDAAVVSPDAGAVPQTTFSVGGTVSGLTGTGLVLQDNNGDDLAVAASGTFTFPTRLATGAAFHVSIKTQPSAPSQTCTVSGEQGTVAAGNVTSVAVNCATDQFTIGGTVTGLVGTGLTLQNNGGADLVVSANGKFAFGAPVASGVAYAVTVKTQPGTPSQTCVVTSGTGTVAAANITSVAIACTTNTFKVGGTVAGLTGSGLTLQLNGAGTLAVPASGPFTFATAVPSGAAYAVTVSAQPTNPAQTCTVMGGAGTVGAADVTSVAINCTTNKYTVGGTASGIVGTAVLQINGGDDLNVSAVGGFAFSTPLDDKASYTVTIKSQPGSPSQTCVLANATGTIAAAKVTDITLTCVTDTFNITGNISGLSGTGLVLQDNGADDITNLAAGPFAFPTKVASGQNYAVTVKTQPTSPSQTCSVNNASGKVAATDVTNVTVTCVTNAFTVGGSIAGLTGTGLVLQDNGGDNYSVPAGAASFTFATKVPSGNAYAVSILSQPSSPSQSCSLMAASGVVANGNVVTVGINCTTNKYLVGGTVSGLAGTGLVLQDNGADNRTINGNGAFALGTAIASGTSYAVTVLTQPTSPSQTCVVGSPSGTVSSGDVTSVTVSCTTNTYSVGGNVSGLAAAETVVLQDNGGDNNSVQGSVPFTFATKIASGGTYSVTVLSSPAGKFCSVSNGTGTVSAGAVTNVTVACVVAPPGCARAADNTVWCVGQSASQTAAAACGYPPNYAGTYYAITAAGATALGKTISGYGDCATNYLSCNSGGSTIQGWNGSTCWTPTMQWNRSESQTCTGGRPVVRCTNLE